MSTDINLIDSPPETAQSLGHMASQQPTKVGVWCSLHTRTLICPEQCVKLSEGKKGHSPKYIC